jgi:hypothetical protein
MAQNFKKVLKQARILHILACHLQNDADPDPTCHFVADADPDPVPTFQFDADPCRSSSGSTTLAKKVFSSKNFARIPGHCIQTALQYFIN